MGILGTSPTSGTYQSNSKDELCMNSNYAMKYVVPW